MHVPARINLPLITLLALVSVAFLALLWPFYQAVFWSVALAILFTPLYRRMLRRMPGRANWAALCTLLLCMVVVILPMTLIAASVVQEVSQVYERLRSGQLNIGAYVQQIFAAIPSPVMSVLERFDLNDLSKIQERLSALAVQAGQMAATQAVNFGQNTMQFVIGFGIMLYLLFFLLRDGSRLASRIKTASPLATEHTNQLLGKLATVVRATVKGNVVVAATQGALGGFILWALGIQGAVLWGVLMAFLSLLPAVGAGLIWGPVAIYFFATGAIWQGVVLTAFGVGVIGLVDNLLRPILVGKDTKMPDYMVLISTLGGMALFGLTGFVIGPLIAALFMVCWELYIQTRDHLPTAGEAPPSALPPPIQEERPAVAAQEPPALPPAPHD